MDDLLALMGEGPDDGPPPAAAPASSSGGRASEDTSGGADERRRQQSSPNQAHHVPRSATARNNNAPSSSSSSVEAAQKKRRQDQSTLDPLTNLRITNRRTSRFDLSDALAPHEFVTTARLAAMSTRDLGRFITQPSNRANDSGGGFSFGAGPAPDSNANNFTGGKSNLATMGVLFSNSGSKVSPSTGRAYSIFQLGDLSTGPAVSVFLFGDAYSRHTGNGSYAGKAGSVVAILSPNILPPKRGGTTSVSLSVNSADQIVHVGTAQDYGVCSGMIRIRREGRFVDTRCTKFVDKRCGQFCQAHRRQGLQQQVGDGNRMASSSTSSAAGLKKNGTFLQQFRAEGRSNSAGGGPSNTNMAASNGQQGNFGSSRGGMQSSSNLASALAAAGMDHGATGSTGLGNMAAAAPVSTNAMLQQQGGGRKSMLNAPRHMVKTSIPGASRISTANAIPRAAVGAAASTKLKRPPLTRAGKDVFGDTMRRGQVGAKAAAARTSLVTKAKPKERKVATFGGYSGSVQVPKPSRSLFGDAPESSGMAQHLAGSASVAVTPSPNPEELRERQRRVAEQMRKRKHDGGIGGSSGGGVTNPYLRGAPKAATSGRIGGSTQGRMDDIFAGLEELDRADAIAAKSSYQSEADAEQYARSRQAVNDLERKETQKIARDERKKKQMKGSDEKAIQVQWICTTCGRESASQLVLCQTKNHKVKKKRTIKEATTKEESRDKLNKKRAEDGGLQLGSGLEWSGFRGA